jgi:uncharacterized protein YndB with AHSA1/START domain
MPLIGMSTFMSLSDSTTTELSKEQTMTTISHRVGIKAPIEKVYQALTTNQGLMSWWTNDIKGAGNVGTIIKFRFNGGGPDFMVTELVANKRVCWRHSGDMPEAWMNTEICFDLEASDQQVFVNFSHTNWQQPTPFMAHCSTKWAVFMLSLKNALETGKGSPFPNDIQIDHS